MCVWRAHQSDAFLVPLAREIEAMTTTLSQLLATLRANRPDLHYTASRAGNAVAVWSDGAWRTIAALGIDGRWYHGGPVNPSIGWINDAWPTEPTGVIVSRDDESLEY